MVQKKNTNHFCSDNILPSSVFIVIFAHLVLTLLKLLDMTNILYSVLATQQPNHSPCKVNNAKDPFSQYRTYKGYGASLIFS